MDDALVLLYMYIFCTDFNRFSGHLYLLTAPCLQKFFFLVMFSNLQVRCECDVSVFLQVHSERLNPLCEQRAHQRLGTANAPHWQQLRAWQQRLWELRTGISLDTHTVCSGFPMIFFFFFLDIQIQIHEMICLIFSLIFPNKVYYYWRCPFSSIAGEFSLLLPNWGLQSCSVYSSWRAWGSTWD